MHSKEVKELISYTDLNKDGKIQYDEFVKMIVPEALSSEVPAKEEVAHQDAIEPIPEEVPEGSPTMLPNNGIENKDCR